MKKFLIIFIEYFTKWAEPEPVATITKHKMESFVRKFILSQFGILLVIMADNGRQFDDDKFRGF